MPIHPLFINKKNTLSGAFYSYGGGGIRTLDTGINPYNGLANRRFRPLSHPSKIGSDFLPTLYYIKLYDSCNNVFWALINNVLNCVFIIELLKSGFQTPLSN